MCQVRNLQQSGELEIDTDRLEDLTERYLDGVISESEQLELEAMLLSSSSARSRYWECADLHALVRRFAEEKSGRIRGAAVQPIGLGGMKSSPVVFPKINTSSTFAIRGLWFALAPAFMLVVAYFLIPLMFGPVPQIASHFAPPPAKEKTSKVVGIFSQSLDAKWNATHTVPLVGEPLVPCRLQLESGSALIDFICGASVLLEGPVDFEIRSSMEAYCYKGRLSAEVPPPATGFRIGTPDFDVIDRGTSFGVVVGDSGQSEVHVLDGLVEVSQDGFKSFESLKGGRALISEEDKFSSRKADPSIFLSSLEFVRRATNSRLERHASWLVYSAELQKDKSLVARYDFQPDSPNIRILKNRVNNSTLESSGTIIGCQWAEGRWPGKQALEFNQSIDRVRLRLSDPYEAITMMAWVRVDSLPNKLNTLFHSDKRNPGGVVWEIVDNAALKLAVAQDAVSPDDGHALGLISRSWRAVPQSEHGHWLHLTVVVDTAKGEVCHWKNGVLLNTTPFESDRGVKIDTAEIGNWQPIETDIYPVRNFNGRMDEFMIFSRVLSGDEIKSHYEKGRL